MELGNYMHEQQLSEEKTSHKQSSGTSHDREQGTEPKEASESTVETQAKPVQVELTQEDEALMNQKPTFPATSTVRSLRVANKSSQPVLVTIKARCKEGF